MAIATENHLTTFVQPLTIDPTFVALPSDPNVPLTSEQLDALFPPQHRQGVIRDLFRLTAAIRNPVESAQNEDTDVNG